MPHVAAESHSSHLQWCGRCPVAALTNSLTRLCVPPFQGTAGPVARAFSTPRMPAEQVVGDRRWASRSGECSRKQSIRMRCSSRRSDK